MGCALVTVVAIARRTFVFLHLLRQLTENIHASSQDNKEPDEIPYTCAQHYGNERCHGDIEEGKDNKQYADGGVSVEMIVQFHERDKRIDGQYGQSEDDEKDNRQVKEEKCNVDYCLPEAVVGTVPYIYGTVAAILQ